MASGLIAIVNCAHASVVNAFQRLHDPSSKGWQTHQLDTLATRSKPRIDDNIRSWNILP
jgi:hypothetical protein